MRSGQGSSRVIGESIDALPFLRRRHRPVPRGIPLDDQRPVGDAESRASGARRRRHSTAPRCFAATQAREARAVHGRLHVLRRDPAARVGAACRSSSIDAAGHGDGPAATAGLRSPATAASVLAGRLDAVAQNGIDDWRGGVHLAGNRPLAVALGQRARNVGIMTSRHHVGTPRISRCTPRRRKRSPTTCASRSSRGTRPSSRSRFRTSGSSTTRCGSRTKATKPSSS